jgi:hypothetical protein
VSSGVLIGLFAAAFALQIGGIAMIVWEIVGDVQAARVLREREDAPDPPRAVTTRIPERGVEITVGGAGMQQIIRGMYQADSFRDFVAMRLGEGIRRRWLGVGLIVVGGILDLVANIGSVL